MSDYINIRTLLITGAALLVPLALFLAGETIQTAMLDNLNVRFVPENAIPLTAGSIDRQKFVHSC